MIPPTKHHVRADVMFFWLFIYPDPSCSTDLVSKELRAIGAHNLWQSTWAKSWLDLVDTRLTSGKEGRFS
jgi:hypothetical protein